jgi:hypothetical protein
MIPTRRGVAAAVVLVLSAGQAASATNGPPANHPQTLLLELPEAAHQAVGATRVEWNYTFLRDNFLTHIFNADQSQTGTRSQHRKTHLVTWRVKHGVAKRHQAEMEIVYKAFRQHTHADGDAHDRNDDGDFERLLLAWSAQLLSESQTLPALRLRGGALLPRRAETEGIGQETGFDLLAASSKRVGGSTLHGMIGLAMTFDNRDHLADPIFDETPISKAHDLRTLVYGIGLTHPLGGRWQANVELSGRAFDAIELNRRVHESELTATPGLFYTRAHGTWEWWMGAGLPIGLTSDTDHLGVSIRTGARF